MTCFKHELFLEILFKIEKSHKYDNAHRSDNNAKDRIEKCSRNACKEQYSAQLQYIHHGAALLFNTSRTAHKLFICP